MTRRTPARAAGDQIGEETVPGRAGLGGRDLHAEDFAVPVAVDAGGQEHDGVDDPAALADLHRQGVGGHERERARLRQRAVAELLDVLVQIRGHARDLRLREVVDAQGLDQLVHATSGDAGEVAVRHDRDQRGLGALAALQQPLGEIGAGA